MSLPETIRKFIENAALMEASDRLLVAVSGGMDSMALFHVLIQLDLELAVVHVNYQLRGNSSDLDEALVADTCKAYGIQCHIHTVNENEVRSLANSNLQNTARKIRYDFFDTIMSEHGYTKIATAHHEGDVAETFLLNAMRGSGMQGLSNIQPISGRLIRPMLRVSKEDILLYVNENGIDYRDDESNVKDNYNRNYLRHKVLPALETRWPLAQQALGKSSAILSEELELQQYLLAAEASKWMILTSGITHIGPISELKKVPGCPSLLRHFLLPFGVSQDRVIEILNFEHQSGIAYTTATYKIILDRDYLLLKPISKPMNFLVEIATHGLYETAMGEINICESQDIAKSDETNMELVDADKIQFPLVLRTWKQGDKWAPLGMKGKKKKVSDFLIDIKMDLISKESIMVLEDATGSIIWLVGHRINELCKITTSTSSKLSLTWSPKAEL